MKQNKDKKPQTEINEEGRGVVNMAQTMDGVVIVAGALHFSSGFPAARIKGLQDRFLTTHWLMKGDRFAEEFLFLGTKFYGV